MAGKMNEIAETRTLYFNPFYPGGRLGKLGKKIFQKMTRPMLTKQVEFNTSVRDILIQISTAITAIEVNIRDLQLANAVVANLEWDVKRLVAKERQTEDQPAAKNSDTLGTLERTLEKGFVLQSLARLYQTNEISVLEVVTDGDYLANDLAALGYNVTATGIPSTSVTHPYVNFVMDDLYSSTLMPAFFDCVIAFSSLDHAAMEQIYGLLKPEGHFILTVPDNQEPAVNLAGSFTIDSVVYGVRSDEATLAAASDKIYVTKMQREPKGNWQDAITMMVCSKRSAETELLP
jgi:SAM-dependent methyltransferase